MIQLLFTVIFAEMAMIMVLLFKTPLRKLVIMGLDRVKRGRGFTLFLALMIDRLHHYIRELRLRRKSMEAIKKQNRGFEDGKTGGSAEIKAMEEEMAALGAKLKQLESEIETKTKEAKAAETNAVALRKQSEGFLLEYDRLLEENQNLRNQLQSLDRRLSHSGSKKNT
uniref:Endoplasmic reticulum transmembrane protein n=1 Tax=Vitis vinifera TaxID=29760 RepID=F6H7H5_VITVI